MGAVDVSIPHFCYKWCTPTNIGATTAWYLWCIMTMVLEPTDRPTTKPWIQSDQPLPQGADLLLRALSVSVGAHRCGEMWGTDCPRIVHPPHFEHPEHPAPVQPVRRTYSTNLRILWTKEAESPDCSPQRLRKLASCSYITVRLPVAQHPNCPVDVLAQLAGDQIWYIRQAVAKNPNTDGATLAAMLADKRNRKRYWHESIATSIKAHPNYDPPQ